MKLNRWENSETEAFHKSWLIWPLFCSRASVCPCLISGNSSTCQCRHSPSVTSIQPGTFQVLHYSIVQELFVYHRVVLPQASISFLDRKYNLSFQEFLTKDFSILDPPYWTYSWSQKYWLPSYFSHFTFGFPLWSDTTTATTTPPFWSSPISDANCHPHRMCPVCKDLVRQPPFLTCSCSHPVWWYRYS